MAKQKEKDEEMKEQSPEVEELQKDNVQEKAEEAKNESDDVTLSKEEYEALKAQASELFETKEKLLRTVAEFENSKRRIEKQKDEFVQYANKKLLSELLPIIDNFDRAIQSSESQSSYEALKEGLLMIQKQVMGLIEANGVEKIKAVGEPFDPNHHEAIGTVETAEHDDDIVVEEISSGYKYKDFLLKPAMVRVSVSTKDKNKEEKDGE